MLAKRILLSFMSVLLLMIIARAQVTTSNLSGIIKGPANELLAGATITATHLPTGTTYSGTSSKSGRYSLNNIQPGGPYKIEVSFVGFEKQVREDIFLNLGETGQIDVSLSTAAAELTAVVVTTSRRLPNVAKGGVETSIGRDRLQNAPTVGRNLADFIRLVPQAKTTFEGGISIAGQNNRYNQLMIDGAVNNDVFGLSASGANGGQTNSSPISIDAIESFQVGVSPYDVSLGNFTGGSINAITKSGTNRFTGSAYHIFRNESITGKTPTGDKSAATKLPDFSAKIYGITVGGPIIKNKLFFFLSGEIQKDERPQPFDPSTFRVGSFQDSVNLILSKLNSLNYDPGAYLNIPDLVNSDKIAAKVTWNVSKKHRVNFSYRYTNSDRALTSASTSTRVNFFNNGYLFPSRTSSASLELNSNLTNRVSNKLLVTYTDVLDDRDPLGADFPRVTLNSTNGTSYVFGTENFSTGNQLKQNNFAVYDEFRLTLGNHQVKAGIDIEFSKSYNLFVRDAYGNYTYGSVSNFLNDMPPSSYSRNFSLVDDKVGDGSAAGSTFKTARLGFFVGDEWNLAENFQLNYGVRLDNFEFLTTPNTDTFFNKNAVPVISQYWDLEGARSGQRPEADLSISPRVGFTYNFPDEGIKVRGGIGAFTGRVPLVWPGGVYNNTGVNVGGYFLNNPNITFRSDPFGQYTAAELGASVPIPSGQIDLISRDFKLPKVLKASLGMDKRLGKGFNLTIDLLYQKNINEIIYTNVYGIPGGKSSFGQDVYLRYTGTGNPTYNRLDFNPTISGIQNPYSTGIFLISNAKGDKGYAYNLSVMLDKAFSKGWTSNVSYSYGDSYSLFDGTSSQNNSQWRFIEAQNGRNNLTLSRSDFAQLHRVNLYVSKRFEYMQKKLATTVTLFYNGQSGSPYSYVYTRSLIYDQNGSNSESTDLIYVPRDFQDWARFAEPFTTGTGANAVTYSVAQQWEALDAYINNDGYLRKRRGQFAERNESVLPFSHVIDLKLQQDFNVMLRESKHTFSVSMDIFNFTNFLNREWGRVYATPGVDSYSLISMEGYTPSLAGGEATYKPRLTYRNISNKTAADILDNRGSNYLTTRWRGQVTVRYSFN
jgi:outer membrane receptor for ferrienterochelin and colicin